jgi:capsular exopolysaccharide synthesis family protein
LVVDADLRRPAIARQLGLEGSVGLTTLLIDRVSLDDVVQSWGNGNLDVITSGTIPPNPSELLGSKRMTALLDELIDRYEIVLVDTAPLGPVTDGAILAKLVGSSVLVVGFGELQKAQLSDSVAALKAVNATVLGVVANRVPIKNIANYAGAYESFVGEPVTVNRMPRPVSPESKPTPTTPATASETPMPPTIRSAMSPDAIPPRTLPHHSEPRHMNTGDHLTPPSASSD